jgi:hypothetical protein
MTTPAARDCGQVTLSRQRNPMFGIDLAIRLPSYDAWRYRMSYYQSDRTERLANIETNARLYAHSGDHLDFTTIEARLIREGYPEARKLFANLWTRNEVNRICQHAFDRTKGPEAFLRLGHLVAS